MSNEGIDVPAAYISILIGTVSRENPFFCIISEIIDRSKLNCICCLISIIDS